MHVARPADRVQVVQTMRDFDAAVAEAWLLPQRVRGSECLHVRLGRKTIEEHAHALALDLLVEISDSPRRDHRQTTGEVFGELRRRACNFRIRRLHQGDRDAA